jgi:scyllo-inositol 2-dehydrogenase (NADP+)
VSSVGWTGPMGSARVVGVGLVGYGVSGSGLHAPLIGAEPRLRLRAVASRSPERVHRDLPAMRVVPTAEDLLDDPDVELVVIAAPNEVHFGLAAAALRAGRHVVVDKPFVPTSAEADDLVALARDRDRALAAFHNRRWDGDYLTVRRCVAEGLLGRVSTYVARYDRFRPEPTGGWREEDRAASGLLYDLGPHLVDQALHLFGPPETVLADVGIQRSGGVVDDYFHLLLGYGELRVILHAGSLVRSGSPRFEVHGDRGSYVKSGVDGQVAALLAGRRPGEPGWGIEPEDRHGTLTTSLGGLASVGRLATVPGSYESFYRGVASAILEGGPVPVSGVDAAATIRVLECALVSSREGCRVALQ